MILQPSVSFVEGSRHKVVWLGWLIVVGILLAGCGSSSDLGQQEPTQGQIEPYDGLYDPRIEDEARRITSDVAEQLTKELGVETIAQSRNNGVKVRCARPEDTRSPVICRVDRGVGWQELAVMP